MVQEICNIPWPRLYTWFFINCCQSALL